MQLYLAANGGGGLLPRQHHRAGSTAARCDLGVLRVYPAPRHDQGHAAEQAIAADDRRDDAGPGVVQFVDGGRRISRAGLSRGTQPARRNRAIALDHGLDHLARWRGSPGRVVRQQAAIAPFQGHRAVTDARQFPHDIAQRLPGNRQVHQLALHLLATVGDLAPAVADQAGRVPLQGADIRLGGEGEKRQPGGIGCLTGSLANCAEHRDACHAELREASNDLFQLQALIQFGQHGHRQQDQLATRQVAECGRTGADARSPGHLMVEPGLASNDIGALGQGHPDHVVNGQHRISCLKPLTRR